MQLLFVRHGQSTANTSGIFANRGWDTFPLTPVGRRQANGLATQLGSEPISHVYTSPLLRARETAAIVAASRALPRHTAPALAEYDVGDFELQSYLGVHAWRMRRYQENETCWRQGATGHRLAGGESLTNLRARLYPFIGELQRKHASTGTPLLIGHGGLFRVTLPVLLENVTFDFAYQHPMDHGTVVRATATNGRLLCHLWGSVSFA